MLRCWIKKVRMKTNHFLGLAAVLAAGVAFSAVPVLAQDSTTDVSATVPSAPAPQLAYGVSQILQLSQAKVPDDTIVTYIKGTGTSYGLTADQIIYLQQHGVSSTVINTMLTQPRAGVMAYSSAPAPAAPVPTTPAPAPVYDTQPASTVVVTPPVTAIDPSATAYYYSYPSYYYPSYGYGGYYGGYSPVVFSVGWGRGWGGYGWRGGYGWHGGGGYYHGGYGGYGGGFHGNFGGGFHGGGGGGFHGGWHH
jgi:hypothetical protein